ncbi:unnamed protein product, partial [Mesorhabditis spiculigera]
MTKKRRTARNPTLDWAGMFQVLRIAWMPRQHRAENTRSGLNTMVIVMLGPDLHLDWSDPFARPEDNPLYELDVPSTDPDHKKKNSAALRENLRLRQYTGPLNTWATELDGFHRFAIEKGRTQLIPQLERANQLDAAQKARVLEERIFASHFNLPLDSDGLSKELNIPRAEV